MAFSRLLVVVTLAASQLASAAVLQRRAVTCPGGQTTANQACCALFPVVDLLQKELFEDGQCEEDAHAALRLAFHDAIGFATGGGKGGGADGSILAFNSTETKYAANDGTDDIVVRQWPIFQKSGLSAGDFVHLAAAVGTANCPGAPRLHYSVGRPAPTAAAPDGTVPEPTDSVDAILARFGEAGIGASDVIWLLASHSIATASKVDPTIPHTPFDSTPSTFDTQFYLDVLLKGKQFPGSGQQPAQVLAPIPGEMRLASDFALSQDSRTSCQWQLAVDNQQFIMNLFSSSMKQLQLLGQTGLTDCSDVIPVPKTFTGHIKYPTGFNQSDVQVACSSPFPTTIEPAS